MLRAITTVLLALCPLASVAAQSLFFDIQPGTASGDPNHLVQAGNLLFFAATDASHGDELWCTDSTPAGTQMVRDINPGTATSLITGLYPLGSRVVFAANDGSHGSEPWVSDGTLAGTFMLADIAPGGIDSSPGAFTASGGWMYFTADDQGAERRELWRTDGTSAGTSMVLSINLGFGSGLGTTPETMIAWRGGVIFQGDDGTSGTEPWFSDGTVAGTARIADINPAGASWPQYFFQRDSNLCFFVADDGSTGSELWRTDGTVGGTYRCRDTWVGGNGGGANYFALRGGIVYFTARDSSSHYELYRSDGTVAGTYVLRPNGGVPRGLVALSNCILYHAETVSTGRELWTANGLPGNNQMVRNLQPGAGDHVAQTTPLFPVGIGNWVVYGGQTSSLGNELWITDGTAQNSYALADLVPGTTSSSPQRFATLQTPLHDLIFFAASTTNNGRELFSIARSALARPRVETFGVGCAGTNNQVPGLQIFGYPELGGSLDFVISQANPISWTGLLMNFTSAITPLGACTSYVAMPAVTLSTYTDPYGGTYLSQEIPNNPAFLGLPLYVQALVADPQGLLFGAASMTNAGHIVVTQS